MKPLSPPVARVNRVNISCIHFPPSDPLRMDGQEREPIELVDNKTLQLPVLHGESGGHGYAHLSARFTPGWFHMNDPLVVTSMRSVTPTISATCCASTVLSSQPRTLPLRPLKLYRESVKEEFRQEQGSERLNGGSHVRGADKKCTFTTVGIDKDPQKLQPCPQTTIL